jgi:hypothetical protein
MLAMGLNTLHKVLDYFLINFIAQHRIVLKQIQDLQSCDFHANCNICKYYLEYGTH